MDRRMDDVRARGLTDAGKLFAMRTKLEFGRRD